MTVPFGLSDFSLAKLRRLRALDIGLAKFALSSWSPERSTLDFDPPLMSQSRRYLWAPYHIGLHPGSPGPKTGSYMVEREKRGKGETENSGNTGLTMLSSV